MFHVKHLFLLHIDEEIILLEFIELSEFSLALQGRKRYNIHS